jgi:LacI family repressor for deo operon, udp, cdd, tsx, nupC, and nupG
MTNSRLRDVAELAGVSIRTVSNVVNGYAPVSEPTRLRVQAAVEQIGYRPNVLARNLKQGRSGLVALVVPELDVPYFAELTRAVIGEARRQGFTVVVDQTDGDPERERELILTGSRGTLFDGVILSPMSLSQEDLVNHGPQVPLVLLGERTADGPFDHVGIDNAGAALAATEHLFQIGRRRVAAIGDQPYETGETAQLRTYGYRQAHLAAGRDVDERLIVGCAHFHREDGARAMAQLLDGPGPPPDAVFCFNDLLALGALRTLLARGYRVPEDVAIIGFDDIEDGRYATPSLSTISPDKAQIAHLAVARLTGRMHGAIDTAGTDQWADYQLVERETTSVRPAVGTPPAVPRRSSTRSR